MIHCNLCNKFIGHPKLWYCSDECRKKARRETYRKYMKKYRKQNPDKVAVIQKRYRMRKRDKAVS